MSRRIIFTIHSYAGLLSGLFILLMSVSGSILVFSDELDQLQQPPGILRANSAIVPIDTCYAHVQREFPRAQISSCDITYSSREFFEFTIYDSSQKNGIQAFTVYLNPQDGSIRQTRLKGNSIPAWLGKLHSSLFLGKTGEWILGLFSLVFLTSLLTGFLQFRNRIVPVLLFRGKAWRKNKLHHLIGTYALVFNLVIGITGFWMQRYVFKPSFYKSSSFSRTIHASPTLAYSIDTALDQVRRTFPLFTAYRIYFPSSKGGTTVVYGSLSSNSFIHSKKLADAISLDSAGRVSSTAFVDRIDASSRYDIINAQVHFGQFGGLPVKILYSVFGLSGGVLSITGFCLWYRRRRSLRRD
jgi:uncharacterized iron-regulated membrane protein